MKLGTWVHDYDNISLVAQIALAAGELAGMIVAIYRRKLLWLKM